MDALDCSAREYIGCISSDDVQRALIRRNEGNLHELENPLLFYSEVRQAWRHFKAECVCRRLHDNCVLSDSFLLGGADEGKQKSNLIDGVTAQQLQDAAKDGCWFCSIIYKGIEGILARKMAGEHPENIHNQLQVRAKKQDIGTCLLRVTLIFPSETRPEIKNYEFHTQEGQDYSHICACFQTAPAVPPSTALPQSFIYAKRQLTKCIKGTSESHIQCEAGDVELPTRVLQITEQDGKYRTQLLITNGLRSKYVALSHCWGLKELAVTTSVNLGERQVGIPWNCLSRTFRDAIHITHRLGFHFLWIDALYILQDNSLDWQRESGRMHLVYQNCALMISADKARDGDGGCFNNEAGGSWVIKGSPHDFDIAVRQARSHSELGPLAGSAWAFQERTLARRILHYTADELVWECGGIYACQCGDIHNILRFRHNAVKFLFSNCGLGGLVDRIWHGLVADYSARILTIPEDRLPAFSGLAKQFESTWKELIKQQRATDALADHAKKEQQLASGGARDLKSISNSTAVASAPKSLGSYVAGMWSNYLDVNLLWTRSLSNPPLLAKPAKCIAPSWSWASINASIQYTIFEEKTRNVSIKTAVRSPSSIDPNGAVRAGHLQVSGQVITLVLSCENPTLESGSRTSRGYYTLRDYARRELSANYMPDYLLSVDETNSTDNSSLTVYGLIMSPDFVMVLKKVRDPNVIYSRIGALTFHFGLKSQPADWSRDALEMIMKIV